MASRKEELGGYSPSKLRCGHEHKRHDADEDQGHR
jgi:hypothetical protein